MNSYTPVWTRLNEYVADGMADGVPNRNVLSHHQEQHTGRIVRDIEMVYYYSEVELDGQDSETKFSCTVSKAEMRRTIRDAEDFGYTRTA